MKILLLNNLYAPHAVGGAELSVQALAQALLALGVQPTVLCLGQGDEAGEHEVAGVPVVRVPLQNLHWPFGEARHSAPARLLWHFKDRYNAAARLDLGRVLSSVNPDLVHTHNLAGFSISAWAEVKARGLPLMHTLRDYYLLCPRSTMFVEGTKPSSGNCESPCLRCRLFRHEHRRAVEQVDHVASISEHLWKTHLKHGVFSNATPHSVIRNGIDFALDAAVSSESGRSDDNGPLRLGYIGRVHSSKGIELLIQAMRHPKLRQTAKLLVAGSGSSVYEQELMTLSAGLPVTLTGRMDAANFYESVDVVVVPSLWHEPLSRVVPEAHAHGRPVVAAKRGGLVEIVRCGETGELFDPLVVGELEDRLLRFVENRELVHSMGARARQLAAEYKPARIAKQYLDRYQELIARASKRPGSS